MWKHTGILERLLWRSHLLLVVASAAMGLAGDAGGQALIGFSQPLAIAAGPDDALWFTESTANKIGRITTAGVITEFAIPTSGSFPSGITAGPDTNL